MNAPATHGPRPAERNSGSRIASIPGLDRAACTLGIRADREHRCVMRFGNRRGHNAGGRLVAHTSPRPRIHWVVSIILCTSTNDTLWTFQTGSGQRAFGPVAVVDARVYLGSDGTYCLNATDGSPIWRNQAGGSSSPTVDQGKVNRAIRQGMHERIHQRDSEGCPDPIHGGRAPDANSPHDEIFMSTQDRRRRDPETTIEQIQTTAPRAKRAPAIALNVPY